MKELQTIIKLSVAVLLHCRLRNYLHTNHTIMENSSLKVTLSERLSYLVRPVNYNVILHPDLESGKFSGSVKIDTVVKQEKSYLNLHTKLLNITDVKVFQNDREVTIRKYSEVKQLEQLMIQFENVLQPGRYQININFNGDMTHKIVGLYSSRLNNDRYFFLLLLHINVPSVKVPPDTVKYHFCKHLFPHQYSTNGVEAPHGYKTRTITIAKSCFFHVYEHSILLKATD